MARDLPTFAGPNHTGELQLNFLDRIVSRDLTVVRTDDITPRYRRIVFGGEDLAEGFPFKPFSPLDHVKVFFPHPDSGDLVASRCLPDGEWVVDGGTTDPICRDYTVRAWDPGAKELTLEFVLHEHGVAGKWARTAKPGDRVVANGPSANFILPLTYSHYLVAGDDTALPAIALIVEEAPAESNVTAVIEVTDAQDEQDLQGSAKVDLHWVHRATAPTEAGHHSPLETKLRSLGIPAARESVFVVIAGEANSLKTIRRYYRGELGLLKHQIEVDGYWKRGVVSFDHHDVDFEAED